MNKLQLQSKFRTKSILERRSTMLEREGLHSGLRINCDRLKELHRVYGEGLEEKDFAYAFLDLDDMKYSNIIKNPKRTADILSQATVLANMVHINDLRNKMIYSEGLHIKESINYEKFSELYGKYGEGMTEVAFALEVLDISAKGLSRMRGPRNASTAILQNVDNLDQIMLSIRDRIVTLNQLESRQVLERAKVEEYHQKYAPEFLERTFVVDILDGKSDSYTSFAAGNNNAITILNTKVTNFELLRNKVIRERKLHFDDWITYEDFVQLHQTYAPNMQEKLFAERILDITPSNFSEVKYEGRRARILLGCRMPQKQELDDIRKAIIRDKKFRTMDLITLEEFKSLHEEYGGTISALMFATDVLLVGEYSYKGMVARTTDEKKPTVHIFYNYEMPLEEVESLKATIRASEDLMTPRKMSTDEIEELYNTYGGILSFNKFLTGILGVPIRTFYNCKYRPTNKAMVCVREDLSDDEIDKLNRLLAKGFPDREISEEMGLPVTFLRAKIKELTAKGQISEEDYMYERIGYLMVEKNFNDSEIASEYGLSIGEIYNMVDRYKAEQAKAKKAEQQEEAARKSDEKRKKAKDDRKMSAFKAVIGKKYTSAAQNAIENYISDCMMDYQEGVFEEDDLGFLSDCLTITECGSRHIEIFSKMCINFCAYSLAHRFLGQNIHNESVTSFEREKLQKLQSGVKYAIKKEQALDMLLEGEADTGRIASLSGISEIDVIVMKRRVGETGASRIRKVKTARAEIIENARLHKSTSDSEYGAM